MSDEWFAEWFPWLYSLNPRDFIPWVGTMNWMFKYVNPKVVGKWIPLMGKANATLLAPLVPLVNGVKPSTIAGLGPVLSKVDPAFVEPLIPLVNSMPPHVWAAVGDLLGKMSEDQLVALVRLLQHVSGPLLGALDALSGAAKLGPFGIPFFG